MDSTASNTDKLTPEELIDRFQDDVKSMAYVALTKIHKPSPYDFDDLINEGYIALIESYNRWWRPGRKASLRTFMMICLRSTFFDIVKASYKTLRNSDFGIIQNQEERISQANSPDEQASALFSIYLLNPQEIQYINLLLSLDVDRRHLRKKVREAMNISYEEETMLCLSIQNKIQEDYK